MRIFTCALYIYHLFYITLGHARRQRGPARWRQVGQFRIGSPGGRPTSAGEDGMDIVLENEEEEYTCGSELCL